MQLFENSNFNKLYYDLINTVYNEGITLKKKNSIELKEVIPAYIKISKPHQIILSNEYRAYNPAFMVAELLWNLCGDTKDWLCDYNQLYNQYFQDGELLAGYGNRIFNTGENQFVKAYNLLKEDPTNSHATISIFDKDYDLDNSNFVPCINFIKFRIVNNKLNMFTFMRAQDLWKGFPYDIVLLIGFFLLMASLLNIEIGDYYHTCDSIRIYKEDYEDIEYFLLHTDASEQAAEKIDMTDLEKTTIFSKLNEYKQWISSENFDSIISNLNKEPLFWQSAIKTCFVYKEIRNKNFETARIILNSIEGFFYKQIITWSQKYSTAFYNYITNYNNKN